MDSTGGSTPDLSGTLSLSPQNNLSTTSLTSGTQTVNTGFLIGSFITAQNTTSSIEVVGGLWVTNLYSYASDDVSTAYYAKAYYVDADGSGNKTALFEGTVASAVQIFSTKNIIPYSFYVPDTVLSDITKRFIVEIWGVYTLSTSSITVEFRGGTLSHLHTTLAARPALGPTGPTGLQGPTGPTGHTGSAMSYRGGTGYTPTPPVTAIPSNNAVAVFQVSMTSLSTQKYMIFVGAIVTLDSSSHNYYMTVGGSSTADASAASSTNIVTNATLSTAFARNCLVVEHGANGDQAMNGFGIHTPGTNGTYYYQVWIYSSGNQGGTIRNISLTVVAI
jgi:hypothetical protein